MRTSRVTACGIERVVTRPIWLMRKVLNLEKFILGIDNGILLLFDHFINLFRGYFKHEDIDGYRMWHREGGDAPDLAHAVGHELGEVSAPASRSSMLTRASVGLCQPVESVYIVGCVSVCEVTETLLAFR